MEMKLAPIVLFVYNRPEHTKQTVEALQKNELANESELFIYSDAPKNENAIAKVKEVREYIKSIDGFKSITIVEREKNWGLANSIIDGVTKIVNEYGKIIVLEDDLVTSPYFLRYMNDNLNIYENQQKVASIHGYIYPIEDLPDVFFIKGADCWGWATWKDRWDVFEKNGQILLNDLKLRKLEKEANFNNSYGFTKMLKNQIKGKNDSWAVRWYISTFLQDMLTLYPGQSYVQNIGNDDSGTHCSSSDSYVINLSDTYKNVKLEVKENIKARKSMELFFLSTKKNIFKRINNKIKRMIS
jgi:hypothetical protein